MDLSVPSPQYSADNPFAPPPGKRYSPDNPFAGHALRQPSDDTRVDHPGAAPQDTGILSRIGSSIVGAAEDIYHHPSHLITQPLDALGRTFLVPVKGEAVGDVAQGQAANAGNLGTPGGVPMAPSAVHSSGQTPQEFHRAAAETIANVGAGAIGGELGSRFAPTVGKIAGKVAGRTVANAATGAILNPTDPLVGAATNVATGEALHHTVGAIKSTGFLGNVSDEARSNYMAGTVGEGNRIQAFIDPNTQVVHPNVAGHGISLVKSGGDYYYASPDPSSPDTWTVHGVLKLNANNGIEHLALKPELQGIGLAQRLLQAATNDGVTFDPSKMGPDISDQGARAINRFLQGSGDGLEERNLGPLSSATRQKLVDIKNTALHSPFDPIREQYPDLTAAAEAALSAKANAQHIGHVQTQWVTEGYSPEEQTAFVRQLQADRLNHLAQTDPSVAHNPQFAKNLAQIQSEIPPGFAQSEAFQTMAAKHKALILSQTEPAAANAGLAPDRFANLPNGYLRLVGTQNAPVGTYAEDVGGTGPRPLPTTKTTTAATPATGTADAYSPSYADAVTKDAQDKIVKSAQNRIYQEVAKVGTPIDPTESAPAGQTKIMFDDRGNVIEDPSAARITLAVPEKVAMAMRHVQKTLTDVGPTTEAGLAAKAIGKLGAKAALIANPAAATTHMNTLANVVGSVPEEGKPLNNLVGLAPFGTSAKGAGDIASVDRTDPGTRALEARLSRIGALRPEDTKPTPGESSLLSKLGETIQSNIPEAVKALNPHDLLFGENGVDKRARLALAQKYIDTYKARFDGADPPDAQLRQFVVKGAGDYIKGAGGALIDHLQNAQMSLFARMGIARLSNAGRKIVGNSGLPEATVGQAIGDRAATLTRGVGGAAVGLTLLNNLFAGHPSTQNEPGHETDLQVSTDKDGKPVYVRGGLMYPLVNTAIKGLGIGSLARGDVKGAARDLVNTGTGLATSAPMLKGAIEGATGHQPYFDREGNMAAVGHPALNGGADVVGRLRTAATGMTSLGQTFGDVGPTKNPGIPAPLNKVLGFVAPPITSTATPGSEARMGKQDVKAFMDDRIQQVYRAAGDKAKQAQIIQDALDEARSNKMPIGQFQADLRRAQAKSGSPGAIQAAARRYQAKYGTSPSTTP